MGIEPSGAERLAAAAHMVEKPEETYVCYYD